MIYTDFIEALLVGDSVSVGKLSNRICVLLVDYLKLRVMAEEADAQDASQQTMLHLLEMGTNQKIENTSHAAPYILKMLRNNYYKILNSRRSFAAENIEPYHEQLIQPNQITDLSRLEKSTILDKCVKRLTRKNRELYMYLAHNPNHSVDHIAKAFGISRSNASTRKSRMVKILRDCVESGRDGMVSTTIELDTSDFL
jgi:RNA polymerase sigma factor (sigma-70 family)